MSDDNISGDMLYGDFVRMNDDTAKALAQRYLSFDFDACWVCGSRTAPMQTNVFPTCVSKRKCRRRARRRVTEWKSFQIPVTLNGTTYDYNGISLVRQSDGKVFYGTDAVFREYMRQRESGKSETGAHLALVELLGDENRAESEDRAQDGVEEPGTT